MESESCTTWPQAVRTGVYAGHIGQCRSIVTMLTSSIVQKWLLHVSNINEYRRRLGCAWFTWLAVCKFRLQFMSGLSEHPTASIASSLLFRSASTTSAQFHSWTGFLPKPFSLKFQSCVSHISTIVPDWIPLCREAHLSAYVSLGWTINSFPCVFYGSRLWSAKDTVREAVRKRSL